MALINQTIQLTPEQSVAAQIDRELQFTAKQMLNSYQNIRRLVYANLKITDPNAVYAAFAANTTTGLSPEQLGQAARLIKAAINQFQPNTVVDDVPQAIITY
jgi:hypothetical protein